MPFPQIDLAKVTTRPLAERRNKVTTRHFAAPVTGIPDVAAFIDGLPKVLAADDLRGLIDAIITARQRGRPVVVAMGAHVLKTGLTPLLLHAIDRGAITAFALNSAGSIHDLELALIGETSEDVAVGIEDGSFGMWQETGVWIHRAVQGGLRDGLGYGEALGRAILDDAPHPEHSILAHCADRQVPATIHAAIGTDIVHMHPEMNGAAIGEASFIDFKIISRVVADLEGGDRLP
jgi:hypothetical protein